MDKNLLTIKQLSETLQVHRQTIWEWRNAGMPCIKHGKFVRFKLDEVIGWLESQGTSTNGKQ